MKRLLAACACIAACKKGETAQQGKGGDRVVPVVVAQVQKRDVPVYLDGLGTVTAYRTVTVRTQVDGKLEQLFFKEGQPVKQGQPLAQIDPRPFQIQLQQAQGALARDEAQLRAVRLNLARNKELLAQKLISSQDVDNLTAQVGQLEGAVQIDQAQVSSARLNLSYARIVAPMDGVTGIRAVDPGNFVRASDANGLVVLAQLDPVAVIFTLPQDVLPQISAAQGPLEVSVFARDGNEPLGTGRLELVDNQINAATATLRLKAVLQNPDHTLWPNQFVKVRLKVSTLEGALTVPATALQRGPDNQFVYAVQADQTVAPKTVQVQRLQGDLAILGQGLNEGDTVVIEGATGLRPGAKVQAQKKGDKPQGAPREGGPQGAGGRAQGASQDPGGAQGPGSGSQSSGRAGASQGAAGGAQGANGQPRRDAAPQGKDAPR